MYADASTPQRICLLRSVPPAGPSGTDSITAEAMCHGMSGRSSAGRTSPVLETIGYAEFQVRTGSRRLTSILTNSVDPAHDLQGG